MDNKVPGPIEKIVLNVATYHGAKIEPTLINFFYGNNGTGKSTIARVVAAAAAGQNQPSTVTWRAGKSPADYEVLVYNQQFVEDNLASYHQLKGVFTIGERNIQIEAEVAEKTAQRAEQEKQNTDNIAEKSKLEAERDSALIQFQEGCWERGKAIRDGFPLTPGGFKRKADFATKLLSTTPVEHDLPALRSLYGTAFDPDAVAYPLFSQVADDGTALVSRAADLLANPIASSNDSPFSQFINAMHATDWIRQGHNQFAHAAGNKCPYCQQSLPPGFKEQLADCFDEQYQTDIHTLTTFQNRYQSLTDSILDLLQNNLSNHLPKLDTTLYWAKSGLLGKTIESNLQKIASKLKEPSTKVRLDDLTPLIAEINDIVEQLNVATQENNDIVNAKKHNQQQCTQQVWEMLAYQLSESIDAYKARRKSLDDKITELGMAITTGKQVAQTLYNEIVALNKQVISTAETVNSINELLRHAGFQGFTLREKPGHSNVYEVVRPDGQVAAGLSEGERNFIAFLYFYHLVKGSHHTDGVGKDKIVVIDDPVSSMDSSALFIVASLVRDLIKVCYNNYEDRDSYREAIGDYIKQIFILTHNPYFHREITYNQIRHYDCVSFFMIRKVANNSTVKLCVRASSTISGRDENYNPVKNSYAALWGELQEVQSAPPTMNVIHRILEYYFLQLCGYDGFDIRKLVLEDNRDKFVTKLPNGQEDLTKYQLADSMLSYMNMSSAGVSDGLNYIDDAGDATTLREVFKLIFDALGQNQHYAMMIRESH